MSDQANQPTIDLNKAPEEIKLAVDLIQLLEENEVKVDTAIQALEIVLQDFKHKAKN